MDAVINYKKNESLCKSILGIDTLELLLPVLFADTLDIDLLSTVKENDYKWVNTIVFTKNS